jgi:hypothetical protein
MSLATCEPSQTVRIGCSATSYFVPCDRRSDGRPQSLAFQRRPPVGEDPRPAGRVLGHPPVAESLEGLDLGLRPASRAESLLVGADIVVLGGSRASPGRCAALQVPALLRTTSRYSTSSRQPSDSTKMAGSAIDRPTSRRRQASSARACGSTSRRAGRERVESLGPDGEGDVHEQRDSGFGDGPPARQRFLSEVMTTPSGDSLMGLLLLVAGALAVSSSTFPRRSRTWRECEVPYRHENLRGRHAAA